MAVVETVVNRLERVPALDRLGLPLQRAIVAAYEAGGPVGRRIKDALHGAWLGHPLHAVLTDVPVGAWTAALVLDGLDARRGNGALGRAADTTVAVGVAGAVAAAAAGLTDWSGARGPARPLGLAHAAMNTAALLLYATSLVARRRGARAGGRGLALAGYALVLGSGYLGGRLVYHQGMGVRDGAGVQPGEREKS